MTGFGSNCASSWSLLSFLIIIHRGSLINGCHLNIVSYPVECLAPLWVLNSLIRLATATFKGPTNL